MLREREFAFENAVDGIARFDANGSVTFANKAFAASLGRRLNDVIERHHGSAVIEQDRPAYFEAYERMRGEGRRMFWCGWRGCIAEKREYSVTLHFSIRDTGPGIPPEQIGTIFESFAQADTSITRKHGGTGLGLAISKRIIELMGGRIWVESEMGEGSCFQFTGVFPAWEQPSEMVRQSREIAGLSALIIEDDSTNRLMLRESLSRWGVRSSKPPAPNLLLTNCAKPRASALLTI